MHALSSHTRRVGAYIAPLYAGSFCQAFLATVASVPGYFASSLHMPLKNLAHMPKKFYLDIAGADEIMVSFEASLIFPRERRALFQVFHTPEKKKIQKKCHCPCIPAINRLDLGWAGGAVQIQRHGFARCTWIFACLSRQALYSFPTQPCLFVLGLSDRGSCGGVPPSALGPQPGRYFRASGSFMATCDQVSSHCGACGQRAASFERIFHA